MLQVNGNQWDIAQDLIHKPVHTMMKQKTMVDSVKGSRLVKKSTCNYFTAVRRVDSVIVDREKNGHNGVEFAICWLKGVAIRSLKTVVPPFVFQHHAIEV